MLKSSIVICLTVLVSCSPKSSNTLLKINEASVINGYDVKQNDPIAASMVGIFNLKKNTICSGTLISNNIVVTAAHCAPKMVSDIKIVFSNDIDATMNAREQDILQEYVLSATDFKTSPYWNPQDETREINTGDIALIKIKGTIPEGFRPAYLLPDQNYLKIGSSVIVAGFGVNLVSTMNLDPKENINLDEAISYGEVVCDESTDGKKTNCLKIHTTGEGLLRTTEAPIASLIETEIRLDERRSGTCSGDSGGGAFIRLNNQLYLFGVTSRGSALCNEIGVYTNALYYKNWIIETIKILK